MAMVNVAKREEKEVAKIRKAVEKLTKNIPHAELDDFSKDEKGVWWIQVSSPIEVADDVASIVLLKSDYAVLMGRQEHEGSYDWASGVYNKDCSVVQFIIK